MMVVEDADVQLEPPVMYLLPAPSVITGSGRSPMIGRGGDMGTALTCYIVGDESNDGYTSGMT
jgi:hypothetical protein